MKEKIQSIEKYHSFSLRGNSYDIPAEAADVIISDFEVILSNKDFLERHGTALMGEDLLKKEMALLIDRDNFDDNGNLKDEPVGITETYAIKTKDGGELAVDFYGKDDTDGAVEIQVMSANAKEIEAKYNANEICISDLYDAINSQCCCGCVK